MNQPRSTLASRLRPGWTWLVGAAIGLVAVYLLSREIDWAAAFARALAAHVGWLLLAVAAVCLTNFAKSQRWRALFPPGPDAPTRSDAFGALMVGQVLNFIFPLRAGDLSRAYLMGRRRGASTATAAGTVGAEKLVDLVIVGSLAAVTLPGLLVSPKLGEHTGRDSMLLALLAGIMWLALVLGLPALHRLLARWGQHSPRFVRPAEVLSRLLAGFEALRQGHRLLAVVGWSALIWASAILTNVLMLRALGLSTSLPGAVLIVLIIQSGLSVPVVPGQIGVFEWLAVWSLTLLGVSTEQALAFGLLLHLTVLLVPAIFAAIWLWRRP